MLTLKEKVSVDCDEFSRNHLTCASCLEVYDRSLRLPKVLKCYGYHSICKQCLESICSQPKSVMDRSFSCPICRQKIEIPAKGVSEFPSNPLLIQLLDLLDKHELVPECSKDPRHEPRYCETCDALFCDLCEQESHSNTSLPELKHLIISARRAFKEVPAKLYDEADKWISELDEAHEIVALTMENVEQNSGTVLEDIDLIFGRINSLVDKRHKELLTIARKLRGNKVEILQKQLQLIENEKAKVTSEFKNFQYRGAVGEMKGKIDDLRNRTKLMKVLLIPRTNCSIRHDFTEKKVEQIYKAIDNCGTIWTSETSASLRELVIGKCFAQMHTMMTIVATDSFMERNENNFNCIHATLSGPDECTDIPLKITDGRNGTFKIHFIPPQPGTYQIRVTISGDVNEDYNLKFEVNIHENLIYQSQVIEVDDRIKESIIPNTETDFMKLTANSLCCKVGEKSSNWVVDSKHALDPLIDLKPISMKNNHSPLYCRPLNTMCGSRILCATSLDYSKTAWICVEKSSCSQIVLVNPAKESKKWIESSFSSPGRILCMTSIPIWGFFFVDDRKIDMTYTTPVEFNPEQSSINEYSSENESNPTRPTYNTQQTSPFESSKESSIQNMFRDAATDTLWLGGEDGTIYIWIRQNGSEPCVRKIKVADSVLKIVCSRNRVFVALANGYCIVFIKSLESVLKKSSKYFLISMGEIKKRFDEMRNSARDELQSSFGSITVDSLTQNATTSKPLSVDQNFRINCMESVGNTIWLGYQNCVYILECESLRVVFELRINSENARVEHLTTSGGGGVWCCIRLKSHQIIQLISATEPYQKILEIDIRPDLRRLLIPTFTDLELDFLSRITALKASEEHLWIGTAAGLVLNIPYKLPFLSSKCDLSKVELSLHGFGGTVKFFLMLNKGILSGGEGYRDLMTDSDAASIGVLNENYPHLIHWENSSGA